MGAHTYASIRDQALEVGNWLSPFALMTCLLELRDSVDNILPPPKEEQDNDLHWAVISRGWPSPSTRIVDSTRKRGTTQLEQSRTSEGELEAVQQWMKEKGVI